MTKINGMHDRSPWERCGESPRYGFHMKLTEFRRPCGVCGNKFSIHVTRKIADGHADSNAFGLVNCELHRRRPDGTSEKAVLRSKDRVMTAELDGLYGIERELRAEVMKLLAENAALKNQRKMPWEP